MRCRVLAGVNRDIGTLLQSYCETQPDLHLVDVTHDGQTLLEAVQHLAPDVVVVDLLLPVLDGLAVLESLQEFSGPMRPKAIVLSPINREALLQQLLDLADFCLLKPFRVEILGQRIRHLAERRGFTWPSLSEAVPSSQLAALATSQLLHHVGVPAHIQGYRFLRQAIEMVRDHPAHLQAMTKEVYPTVARSHQTTPERVERSIRHAIEVAWSRGEVELLHQLFGNTINHHRGKPSNSEFIALLAESLRTRCARAERRDVG